MKTLKIIVEYNGANFFGWQKQNGKRTVQGELENAFFSLLNEKIEIEGSGRTDKGVHALGQVASCQISSPIPVKNIKNALNNLLPEDIKIVKVDEVDSSFHARFSAKKKTYKYLVKVGGDRPVINHDTMAYYPFDVNLEKMIKISKLLLGKHDFHGFCASDTCVKSFERNIFDIKIKKRGRIFTFYVTGNGFLYNMVRIIVGTLLDFGRGKLSEDDIKKALTLGERKFAGNTMPSCGLYLEKVCYLD